MTNFEKCRKTVFGWVELVEKLFTIGAIIVGGWWFIHRHEGSPRLNLSQTISHTRVGTKVLLHVSLTLTNSGEVPVELADESTEVFSVAPFKGDLAFNAQDTSQNRIAAWGEDLVLAQGCVGYGKNAPPACEHKNEMKLESGESDSIQWDFIVPNDNKTVRVYSKCDDDGKNDIVWHTVNYYDISNPPKK